MTPQMSLTCPVTSTALVTLTGQGQIHYRIEGNIGMPNFTGVMELKDVFMQQSVDTIKVVNGIITPKEGDLLEMAMCLLADTTKTTVQRESDKTHVEGYP